MTHEKDKWVIFDLDGTLADIEKRRTKARKPAKASGGTRAVRHTTYGGGPAITKVRETT